MYTYLHLLKLLRYQSRKLHATNMDTKDTRGRNKEDTTKYRVYLYKSFLAVPSPRRR